MSRLKTRESAGEGREDPLQRDARDDSSVERRGAKDVPAAFPRDDESLGGYRDVVAAQFLRASDEITTREPRIVAPARGDVATTTPKSTFTATAETPSPCPRRMRCGPRNTPPAREEASDAYADERRLRTRRRRTRARDGGGGRTVVSSADAKRLGGRDARGGVRASEVRASDGVRVSEVRDASGGVPRGGRVRTEPSYRRTPARRSSYRPPSRPSPVGSTPRRWNRCTRRRARLRPRRRRRRERYLRRWSRARWRRARRRRRRRTL